MTYFDVRIPGLKMTVVAADGQYVHPVTVDEFRIAVAETFDVIVEPSGQDAFTIFAQDMGRTGYVNGTLAVREGLRAPVPAVDPRPIMTMADMGHRSEENTSELQSLKRIPYAVFCLKKKKQNKAKPNMQRKRSAKYVMSVNKNTAEQIHPTPNNLNSRK